MSSLPRTSTVRLTIASTSASAVTSQPIAVQRRPRPCTTAAVTRADSASMSAQATSAPASAITSLNCLPRPLPAPVTSATLPSRVNRSIRLPIAPSATRPLLLPCVLAAAQPRKRKIPALARTTITVIHRTTPTTSQPGAGEAGKLRRAFRRPGTGLRGPIRQPHPVQAAQVARTALGPQTDPVFPVPRIQMRSTQSRMSAELAFAQ
jgi:hypothetical protein